jgi:hypothetical protein
MSDTIHIHIERECPVRVITVEPTGARGAAGNAATVAVGTTTTGAAGTNASVTNSGTTSAAVFNFTIPRGDTGATGPAGPNSVTSATTSDYTAELNLAQVNTGVLVVTDGVTIETLDYNFGTGSAQALKDALEIASADISDATSDGDANKEKVLKTDSQGSLTVTNSFGVNASFGSSLTVGDGDSVKGRYDIFANTSHFQWYSDSVLYGEREFVITTENLTSSGAWTYKYPAASGTFAVTASTTGVPDKLTDGTIAGTTTFNSISYTYGTGAAAAHRTALGLTTLATTTPAANVATFLETPTSANLAAAVTGETGSGALVFAASPTLSNLTVSGTGIVATLGTDPAVLAVGTPATTSAFVGGYYAAGSNNSTIYFGQNSYFAGGQWTQPNTSAQSATFLIQAGTFVFYSQSSGNASNSIGSLFGRFSSAGLVVGSSVINSKAKLQVDSTTQGFLPPRMTTIQRDAITSVPAGLMIYNTTLNKLNVYNGTTWETVTSL